MFAHSDLETGVNQNDFRRLTRRAIFLFYTILEISTLISKILLYPQIGNSEKKCLIFG